MRKRKLAKRQGTVEGCADEKKTEQDGWRQKAEERK